MVSGKPAVNVVTNNTIMANKTKKQPLLFPVGDQFVGQAEYITSKTKEVKKANKGASVEEKDIKSLVKIALNNEELADDTDAMWTEALKGILSDIEAGKQHQKDLENEEAAKANKEITVFNAAMKIETVDVEKLNSHFKSGTTFVDVSPEATDEEVAQKFALAIRVGNFTAWAIGDLGNALQDRGLEGVVDNIAANTGSSEATIYGHMRLARSIKKEDRKASILPTVYKELTFPTLAADPKKDAKLKDKLIKQAEKDGWNSKEARSQAEAAREIPAGNQGGKEKGPKANFLVVKDGEAYLVADEPAWEEGVVVVNLSKREVLGIVDNGKGGEKIDWVALSVK